MHTGFAQVIECPVKVAELMSTVGCKHDDTALVGGNE